MCQDLPYLEFKNYYHKAISSKQKNIEAIAISSFSKEKKFVDSRFVNLKFISDKEFIFFSNYNSPKSDQFKSHSQISALLYWNEINVQIRMIAEIRMKDQRFNNNYFKNRSASKNALAISSHQSMEVASYDIVKKGYQEAIENYDLTVCPKYWGGYSFIPTSFEFWEGHKNRLNKRTKYYLEKDNWILKTLSP